MNSTPNLEDVSDVVFYTNRALLCEIRSCMRKVSVEYLKEEKKFILYICIDRALTTEELEYDIPGTILAEISSNFPNAIDIQWEDVVSVVLPPAVLPDKGVCVFRRYESSSDA